MEIKTLACIFVTSLLAFSFPFLIGISLWHAELEVANLDQELQEPANRRQLVIDPQPFLLPVANRVLNVPIPTMIDFFPGGEQVKDECDRDEALMDDGSCQKILTPGNCNLREEVLMDPETKKGFCAPRICPPNRVFIPATQLCHDPRESSVCPPGRELYYSAFGTAVCECPDGTIEVDYDLDEDVCVPILGKSSHCTQEQVFSLKDLNSPPQCLPDPCNGANLKRGPNDLPFVPNKDGQCFQIGQIERACPYCKIYVLDLEKVQGECTTLDAAGYNIFDDRNIHYLKSKFSTFQTSALHFYQKAAVGKSSTNLHKSRNQIIGANGFTSWKNINQNLLNSAEFKNSSQCGVTYHLAVLKNGEIIMHAIPDSVIRSATNERGRKSDLERAVHLRNPQIFVWPHASQSNVFETRLLSCRPGVARGLNSKCRTKVLPSAKLRRRNARSSVPHLPIPTGVNISAYNIRRKLVPTTEALKSVNAFNFG